MKNCLRFIALSLFALAFSARAYLTVLVDTNGTLMFPTNLNIPQLKIAATNLPGNLVTNMETGVTLTNLNVNGGVYYGSNVFNGGCLFNGVNFTDTLDISATGLTGGISFLDSIGNTYYQLYEQNQTLYWPVNFSISGTNYGNGIGLTNLNASQVTSGTLPAAQLPAIVVTNDVANAEAQSYLKSSKIYDSTTRSELDQCFTEMKLGNGNPYFSNCVSLTSFQGRFGTNYNLIGNPVSWLGTPVQTPWGVNFGGVVTGYVSIPQITGNYTILTHYRVTQTDASFMNLHGNGLVAGLKDTNSSSVDACVAGVGGTSFMYFYSETNHGPLATKQIYRQMAGTYYRADQPIYQSMVIAIERSGSSNQVWFNSVQGSWVQDSSTATLTAVTNTFPLNQLVFGGDTNMTGLGPGSFELDSVAVFNTNLAPAQIASAYKAIEWLPQGNTFDVLVGDSRTAQNSFNVLGVNIFNDWPARYYSQNPQKQYLNLALAATTSRQASNTMWGCITNLPVKKYTSMKVAGAYGFNDYYINSATPGEVETNIIAMETAPKNFGARIQQIGPYDECAATNLNNNYSATFRTSMLQQNIFFVTNNFVDDVMPLFWMVSQWDLNPLNPNGFSADGIHFGASTGGTNSVMPDRFASLYGNTGKPVLSPYVPFSLAFWPTNQPASGNTIRTDGTNWYFAN